MARTFKITVYEHITEAFDCEIEIEDDNLTGDDLDDALDEEVERRRVDGDDTRMFVSVDDTDWEISD